MSIFTKPRPAVKPTRRSPLPSAPFGDGILDGIPPINLLEPSTDELHDLAATFAVAPYDDHREPTWLAAVDPDWSVLPQVDGSGCTPEEFARITRAGFKVRAEYRASVPDAAASELDLVETKARQDALRAVLRARPAAPCCDADEAAPCAACVNGTDTNDLEAKHRELMPELFDARDVQDALEDEAWERKKAIPAFKTVDDFGEVDFTAGHEWTLELVIENLLARIARNPGLFTAEWVVWSGQSVMAVIGKRSDGSPFVTMLDETDEGPETEDSNLAGADEHMTPDELRDLAALNRMNPVGAVEAELGKFPAFTNCPESTRNYRWTPRPAPEAEHLLTLPELIEAEADRLRARGNQANELMAKSLDELARVVRTVGAMVPCDVEARLAILDRDYAGPVEFDRDPERTAAGHWA